MAVPLRVVHLITSLEPGGAEFMLARLVRRLDPARVASTVLALGSRGPVAAEIEAAGIPVMCHDVAPGSWVSAISRLPLLIHRLRDLRPDVLHCWLYHANLAGLLAGRRAGASRIVWSLHNEWPDPARTKLATRLVARIGARLASRTDALISPSRRALDGHLRRGYRAPVTCVIPNGFDLDVFQPDPVARREVRAELQIDPDAVVIGMSARFDPNKDHETFFRAARALMLLSDRHLPPIHFVCCGRGVERTNPAISRLAAWVRPADRLHLLGLRRDMPRLYATLDIATLTSRGQDAFPLAIGEAMACGVPCAVTDVGDSAILVGSTGLVVEPGRPDEMARAWAALISEGPAGRAARGAAARQRIATEYSLETIARRHEALYDRLTAAASPIAR